MWKDPDGKIVTKKPTLPEDIQKPQFPAANQPLLDDQLQSLQDFAVFAHQQEGAPISPPISNNSAAQSWDDHDSGLGTAYPSHSLDANALSSSNAYSPVDQRFWSTDLTQPQPDPFAATLFDDAPFDDIFNPDTASSFNNPFTTMSNYAWLFSEQMQQPQIQQPQMQDQFPAFPYNSEMSQPSHAFDIQLEHMNVDRPISTAAQLGSLPSQHTGSPQSVTPVAHLITPPLSGGHDKPAQRHAAPASRPEGTQFQPTPTTNTQTPQASLLAEIERPMSMLQPSRSLPIIDELARAQVLDLIDITQPTAPDGSIVMRDHPLLTLSCLQQYCDLFFTRFNTAYPLIHLSTFDPSEVDTLLLISVLLLGATYGEKDAHQLAVSSNKCAIIPPLMSSGLRTRQHSTADLRQRWLLLQTRSVGTPDDPPRRVLWQESSRPKAA